jgi:hypothetical protein
MMATRLEGKKTQFLPFNQGNHGAAGNAPSTKGHPIGYLWEEVWERESFLDILGRYLVTKKNEKRQIVSYLFPRYHQLAATREAAGGGGERGSGREIPDPALGRLGKDELDCLDGALALGAARRGAQEGFRLGAGGE